MGRYDNPKSLENLKKGNRFSATNQPETQGRPKNIFAHLKGKYSLSIDDVHSMLEYLLSLPRKELERIGNGFKDPITGIEPRAIEIAYAKALALAIKNGNLSNYETVLARRYGSSVQKIETKSTGSLKHMSDADLEALANQEEKKPDAAQ